MKTIFKFHPSLLYHELDDVLKEPVIISVTHFDSEGLQDLQIAISDAHSTGQPVIPVIIDTYGGSSYGLLGMISAFENSKLPIATICTSKALSAGAILFSFGTEGYRYMDPNAILMFHDISDNPDGKLEELKVDVKHLEHLNTMVYKRMAKQVGKPENYILDLMKRSNHLDLYLTAKEAKKHNIANHISVPTMEINVDVVYNFK